MYGMSEPRQRTAQEAVPGRDFPLAPIGEYAAALDEVRATASAAVGPGVQVGEHVAELMQKCERALRLCPATRGSAMRRHAERSFLDLVGAVVESQLASAGVLPVPVDRSGRVWAPLTPSHVPGPNDDLC